MEQYYAVINSTSLSHHGIKGQKWGVRRFQNYDGTRIKGSKEEGNSKRRGMSDGAKTALKIGAIAAATALAAYGGYKLYSSRQLDKFVNKGKDVIGDEFGSNPSNNNLSDLFKGKVDINHSEQATINDFFSANEDYGKVLGADTNCVACALQSALSDSGIHSYKANPALAYSGGENGFSIAKEFSFNQVKDAFPGTSVNRITPKSWKEIDNELLSLGDGAIGLIGNSLKQEDGTISRHAIEFQVSNGKVRYSDNQSASIMLKKTKERGISENLAKTALYSAMSNISTDKLQEVSVFDSYKNDVQYVQINNAKSVDFDALSILLSK